MRKVYAREETTRERNNKKKHKRILTFCNPSSTRWLVAGWSQWCTKSRSLLTSRGAPLFFFLFCVLFLHLLEDASFRRSSSSDTTQVTGKAEEEMEGDRGREGKETAQGENGANGGGKHQRRHHGAVGEPRRRNIIFYYLKSSL